MEKSFTLLLHCFLLSAVEGGVHSLVFLSTGRAQPGSPSSFDQLTVFDGVPISHCGSSTRTEEFKPSLESHDLPQRCEAACVDVIESLSVLPSLTNSTVAFVQRHRGCSLSTSGKNSAFEAWSVNGMSFMTFDPDSQRWTGQSPSAVRVEREWNRNRARNTAFSRFIKQQCPEMIHTIQLKSIQPKTDLNIFTKPTADRAQALLICHVTTTDQSVSSVQLTGHGAPGATWVRVMGPVPGPEDGSVILRLTAVISSTQHSYGCTAGGHNIVWDGRTSSESADTWKILMIILEVIAVVSMIMVLSCSIVCLLRCGAFTDELLLLAVELIGTSWFSDRAGRRHGVKKRRRPPPPVDPLLMELSVRMLTSAPFPELQSVVVSFSRNPGTNREQQEQWERNINTRDTEFYDPEYFANLIKGPSR